MIFFSPTTETVIATSTCKLSEKNEWLAPITLADSWHVTMGRWSVVVLMRASSCSSTTVKIDTYPSWFCFSNLIIEKNCGPLLNVLVATPNLNFNFNWLYLEKNGLFFCIWEILRCYTLDLAFTRTLYLPLLGSVWSATYNHWLPGYSSDRFRLVCPHSSLSSSHILVSN